MKLISTILISALISISSYADSNNPNQLICKKNNDILSANVDLRPSHPFLWGLHLNSQFGSGHRVFENILLDHGACEDLYGRALTDRGDILVCHGELFTPRGKVYGQVLLTNGSLQVFVENISKRAGWNCVVQ